MILSIADVEFKRHGLEVVELDSVFALYPRNARFKETTLDFYGYVDDVELKLEM